MKIPIIINNCNLLEWPKKMIEDISTFEGVGEIIILDNGSTYEPLLEWYETKPCEIIKSEINYGQYGPWQKNIPQRRIFSTVAHRAWENKNTQLSLILIGCSVAHLSQGFGKRRWSLVELQRFELWSGSAMVTLSTCVAQH